MHFNTKSYLKNNSNHTIKQALNKPERTHLSKNLERNQNRRANRKEITVFGVF